MSISTQCLNCKHYTGLVSCKAYPDRIPQEIFNGTIDHTKPYEDDGGITFESINVELSPEQVVGMVKALNDKGALDLIKGEKIVSVKGHKSGKGYVKAYKRKVKTGAEADAEIDTKLAALHDYKEAAARTNEWIVANPNRHDDVGATNEYTVSDYDVINVALRDEFSEEELDDMLIGEQIESISSFLRDAPKFNGIVHRGLGFNLDKESSANQYYEFIDDIMKSDSIVLKPFTSTSQDRDKASEFIGKSTGKRFGESGGILLEIKSKNGVALDGAAEFPGEREVLFDKDTSFKVIDYRVDSATKTYIIKLEEL